MKRIAVLRLWVVMMACLISASACLVAAKPARAATFSAGDRVVVINTTGSDGAVGLKVRSSPAGTQVARKYDGSTGSIISGPVNAALEDGLTYAWWEVRWGDDGVQGWSAERYPVTNGVSYLQRQSKPVSTRFSAGQQVRVINMSSYDYRVRSNPPALSTVANKHQGDVGTVQSGPYYGVPDVQGTPPVATGPGGDYFYYFWQIRWADGQTGWSAEGASGVSYLEAAPSQYSLGTEVSPAGTGSISPSGGSYSAGSSVSLSANAGLGWAFDHWEGDVAGTSNPVTVVMDSGKSVRACFVETQVPQYTLGTEVSPAGTGSISPSGGSYGAGTPVTLTAWAGPGWAFDHWEGDVAGTSNPVTVVMDSGKSIRACLVETQVPQYSLGTEVSPAGAGSVEPSGGSYGAGTPVTLTAWAGPGWAFDHWEGDVAGTSNPVTVVMDSGKSVRACFVQTQVSQYTLSTAVSPAGAGSVEPSGGSYSAGTAVTLAAWAGPGWAFDHWAGDVAGMSCSVTVVMDSSKSVTACFIPVYYPQYTLGTSISPAGAGSISPSGGSYGAGTSVNLTATAGSGWVFDHWEGGATGKSNPVTVTMDGGKSVKACFVASTPASSPAASDQAFLSFPLADSTASSVTINSVFDHDPSDVSIKAYTGEEARKENGAVRIPGTNYFGYKGTGTFSINGHYSGVNTLYYDGHDGYDFDTNGKGIAVLAAAGGTAHRGDATYGTVYIDHDNGYRTIYYHLVNESRIADGRVSAGQKIGIAGGTGPSGPNSFGVHLHFEVRKLVGSQWIAVDPYGWRGSGADPYASRATNVNLWLDAGNSTSSDVTKGKWFAESSDGQIAGLVDGATVPERATGLPAQLWIYAVAGAGVVLVPGIAAISLGLLLRRRPAR